MRQSEGQNNFQVLIAIMGLIVLIGIIYIGIFFPMRLRHQPEVVFVAPPTIEEGIEGEEAQEENTLPPVAPATEEIVNIVNKGLCSACHIIPGVDANGQVGPSLEQIGLDAASRVEGMDAIAYLRQSITDPDAFIAPECPSGPCPSGQMPQTLVTMLSEAEIESIVQYLAEMGVDKPSE